MAYVNTPAFYTAYQSRSADEQPLAVDGDLGDVLDVEIPHAGGVKQFVVRRNQQRMLGLQGLGRFSISHAVSAVTHAVAKVAAPVVKVAEKAAMTTVMGLPLLAQKALPAVASLVSGKPKQSADASGATQYTDANGNPITAAQYNQLMASYNQTMAQTSSTAPITGAAAATAATATPAVASTGATSTPLGPTLSPTDSSAPSPYQPAGYGMDPSYGAPIQSGSIASGYGGGGQSYSDMVTSSDAYDASQEDYGTAVPDDEGEDMASAGGGGDDAAMPMSGLGHGGGGHGGGGHHGGGGFGRRGGFFLPYYDDSDDYPTVVVLREDDDGDEDDDIDPNVGVGALDTGASLVALGAVAFAIYLMVRAQPKRRRISR